MTLMQSFSAEVESIIVSIQEELTTILNDNLAGLYIHGSLAMGGFNPEK
jgi:hypothetical protein